MKNLNLKAICLFSLYFLSVVGLFVWILISNAFAAPSAEEIRTAHEQCKNYIGDPSLKELMVARCVLAYDVAAYEALIGEGVEDLEAELAEKKLKLAKVERVLAKMKAKLASSSETEPPVQQRHMVPSAPIAQAGYRVLAPPQGGATTFDDPQWESRLHIEALNHGARNVTPGHTNVRVVMMKNGEAVSILNRGGPAEQIYADLDRDGEVDARPYFAINPYLAGALYTLTSQGDDIRLMWLIPNGLRVQAPGVAIQKLWVVAGRSDVSPGRVGRVSTWSYRAGNERF